MCHQTCANNYVLVLQLLVSYEGHSDICDLDFPLQLSETYADPVILEFLRRTSFTDFIAGMS